MVCGRSPLASFCTFLTTAWPEPPAVRSIRGKPVIAANRQAFASPPYLAFPQELHDPQIRRVGFCVSKNTRRAPPFRLGDARACFSHRIGKDPPHDPDMLSLRQDYEKDQGSEYESDQDSIRRVCLELFVLILILVAICSPSHLFFFLFVQDSSGADYERMGLTHVLEHGKRGWPFSSPPWQRHMEILRASRPAAESLPGATR